MNNEAKVGAFTLAGAAILAGMISFMGSFDFGSGGYDLTIMYNDALGLTDGAQVRYAGVPVGAVKDVSIVDNKAKVGIRVKDNILLPKGAKFTVSSDGVMGEKFVAINPPEKLEPGYIPQGAEVEGQVGPGMDEFFHQSAALMAKIGVVVDNVDKMLTNEVMQKALKDGATNLSQVTENLKNITNHLKNITGVIDGVAQEPESANALRQTIYNVRDTSANAKAITGNIRKIKVNVNADVGHNMKGGHWRGTVGASVSPNNKDYVYAGVYDVGDKNKLDFVVGTYFGPAGVSAGVMQGNFGVGLSYNVTKMFKVYSQLYDFNNAKVRVGGEVAINKNLSVYGETMDVRHGTKQDTFAGIRAKF